MGLAQDILGELEKKYKFTGTYSIEYYIDREPGLYIEGEIPLGSIGKTVTNITKDEIPLFFKNAEKIPRLIPQVEQVIFNPPATIIIWADDTKTVVKCTEDDVFSEEKGFAMAVLKKMYGGRTPYLKIIKDAKRVVPKINQKKSELFNGPFKVSCNITINEPKDKPKDKHYNIEQKSIINKELYKKYQDLDD